MYYKLALRNAKRSIFDYLLYIVTMTILIAIICTANYITIFGAMKSGFQTASLPLVIMVIMVVLVNYINVYMFNQRAKEFATYLLLGMEKDKLFKMFILEFTIIGVVCFCLGCLLGTGIFYVFLSDVGQVSNNQLSLITKTILITFLFFCIVELFSTFGIKKKVYKLQIEELMREKRRNQVLRNNTRKSYWGLLLISSVCIFTLMLYGITFGSENIQIIVVSFIILPILCCVYAFYKWFYVYLATTRLLQTEGLYQGNRLYRIAEMTSGTKNSALINSVFCICLLFSATSFIFGSLLFNQKIDIFTPTNQRWMGFLQMSICIVFVTIYFAILSLQQIIEVRQQAQNIRILHYMGENRKQISMMMKTQIVTKLSIPTVMCFVLLCIATPFLNHTINVSLTDTMQNILLQSVVEFIVSFSILYVSYFLIVYSTSKRYLKMILD